MEQLYLLATLAGARIAVDASEVEAVVKLTEISPVPGMGVHVAGLSALRSRVLTIIDVAALIHGRATPADQRDLAIIANISGHSYGLMVDGVSPRANCRCADSWIRPGCPLRAAWWSMRACPICWCRWPASSRPVPRHRLPDRLAASFTISSPFAFTPLLPARKNQRDAS